MADAIVADLELSGIYQIRNLVNGKRYIGSAKCFRRRWYLHKWNLRREVHGNRYLQRAWGKYGHDAFVFEVIDLCEVGDLILREQAWIDSETPEYNLSPTAGSCLGVKHSQEVRQRCSDRNKGNKYCLGRQIGDGTRRKISEANKGRLKGRKQSQTQVLARAESHRGSKRSVETRRKISESKLGKKMGPRSAEHRANLSIALRGREVSAEHMAAFQAGRLANVATEEQREAISNSLRDAYLSGKRSRVKTEEHKNKIGQFYAKLTDDEVMQIRKLKAEGVTGRELAKRYGSNPGTISAIVRLKRYRWVS